MTKTILVCGYGPGIGDSVARRFGTEGFQVALVSRSEENVRAGAGLLSDAGVDAQGFACDLSDPEATAAMVANVRQTMGPITVLHWNAFYYGIPDLLSYEDVELQTLVALGAGSLLRATRAAMDDLEAQSGASSVLLTGGGLANEDSDAWSASSGMAGLALCKSMQHKVAGLLHAQLGEKGIYVGEVMVLGMVRGAANPTGTIEPADVAERLWEAYTERGRPLRHIP